MRIISKFSLWLVSPLIFTSRVINKLIEFIDSFLVVILRPEEMLDYAKKRYDKINEDFCNRDFVLAGLMSGEKKMVETYAAKRGRFLVLGSGGGRETIALAKMGHTVVGIDSSERVVERARGIALQECVSIDYRVGDYINIKFPGEQFDYCMLSCIMYSGIPSQRLRVSFLSNLKHLLYDDGFVFLEFLINQKLKHEPLYSLRKFIGMVTRGYRDYMPGDSFTSFLHFFRHFPNEEEVIQEADKAGFIVKAIHPGEANTRIILLVKGK